MDAAKIKGYFQDPLQKILQGLGDNLPLIIESVAIILSGILIAFLFRFLTFRLISGFQRLIRKKMKLSGASAPRLDATGARIASRVVFWGVLLFFLAASLHALNRPVISEGITAVVGYFPKILAATLILFVGFLAGNIFGAAVQKIVAGSKLGQGEFYGKSAKYLIIITSFLIAIEQLGINISLLIILLGILVGMFAGGTALAFALGAKPTVQNILATYYAGKTYQVGQKIQIGDIVGTIRRLEATHLCLETREGTLNVPAAWLFEQPVQILQNE